ncbi:MAG TPA: hypothetical protein VGJ39_15770 [Vicinamibacterales bacterium]|jgi:hypothetical protein
MALPWLGLIDTLLDVANLALTRRSRRAADEPESSAVAGPAGGQLEARMTGVVVAALKEAFDRDARRLELEREQADRERLQAERLLKLELLRQAGDREIGRLRLMAATAIGSWIGTLFFSARVIGGPAGARVMLGLGWLLLLLALSLSFVAQARVGRALARTDEPRSTGATSARPDDLTTGAPGAFVPWLIVAGLGVIGLALLA